MRWFRMYAEAVDDPKLRLLAFEDRWHFVAICCLKCEGLLDSHKGTTLDKYVSVKLGLRGHEVDEVKRRLLESGLINKNWQPVNWNKRQYVSDNVTERVKKHRATMKRFRNVSETPPDTDTDTDTDTDNPKKGYSSSGKPDNCPHQQIIDLWHESLPALPAIRSWTNTRKANLRQRWKESPKRQNLDWWRQLFKVIDASDFLSGRTAPSNGRKSFVATLDWVVKPENLAKIVEGKYDN